MPKIISVLLFNGEMRDICAGMYSDVCLKLINGSNLMKVEI